MRECAAAAHSGDGQDAARHRRHAESRDNFFTIFDGAFARGVAAITVHGRTVKQRYIGPSRWEFLREVKQHAGNAHGARQRRSVHRAGLRRHAPPNGHRRRDGGAARSAIRGFSSKPVALRRLRLTPPPTVHEQRAVIEEHFKLSEELYGLAHAYRMMRKFCIKYARLHPKQLAVRNAFIAQRVPGKMHEVFDQYYSEDRPGRHPTSDEVDEVQECE